MKESMKKPFLAVFGVAGACAACCAIPLAIPLLGGLSLAGAGFMSWETLAAGPAILPLGVGALAAAVLIGIWFMQRRKSACLVKPEAQAGSCAAKPAANACAVSTDDPDAGACGCAPSKT